MDRKRRAVDTFLCHMCVSGEGERGTHHLGARWISFILVGWLVASQMAPSKHLSNREGRERKRKNAKENTFAKTVNLRHAPTCDQHLWKPDNCSLSKLWILRGWFIQNNERRRCCMVRTVATRKRSVQKKKSARSYTYHSICLLVVAASTQAEKKYKGFWSIHLTLFSFLR